MRVFKKYPYSYRKKLIQMKKLKIICISDTHNKHNEIHEFIENMEADVLIHAGDGSNSKIPAINNNELRDCLTWMSNLTHIKHKIYVPGNHDTSLYHSLIKKEEFKNINFLINEEVIIDDVKFYGSPITPTFGIGWAWNCKRGKIDKYWKEIPKNTDILITHGPPYSINDLTRNWDRQLEMCGCKNLLNRVLEKNIKFHIFGHLHDEPEILNHGVKTLGEKCITTFINASIVNLKHEVINIPQIIEI